MMLNKRAARTRVSFVCNAGVELPDREGKTVDIDIAR
jgi:hypothetical protein